MLFCPHHPMCNISCIYIDFFRRQSIVGGRCDSGHFWVTFASGIILEQIDCGVAGFSVIYGQVVIFE